MIDFCLKYLLEGIKETDIIILEFICDIARSEKYGVVIRTDLKELIYGTSLKEGDYGKRPLTKMLQDIVKEVSDR